MAVSRPDLRLLVTCPLHGLVNGFFRFAVDELRFLEEGEIYHMGWVCARIENVRTVFFLRIMACHGVVLSYRVSAVFKGFSVCTRRLIRFRAGV